MRALDDVAHPARLTLPALSGGVPALPRSGTITLVSAGCAEGDARCALPTWRAGCAARRSTGAVSGGGPVAGVDAAARTGADADAAPRTGAGAASRADADAEASSGAGEGSGSGMSGHDEVSLLDGDDVDAVIAGLAATRFVGWRIAVCGEESLVLHVVAAAQAAGLLESEIVAHIERTDARRLYCPSCGATTRVPVEASSAAEATCSGCGRTLRAHEHHSRASGRYLAQAAPTVRGVGSNAAPRPTKTSTKAAGGEVAGESAGKLEGELAAGTTVLPDSVSDLQVVGDGKSPGSSRRTEDAERVAGRRGEVALRVVERRKVGAGVVELTFAAVDGGALGAYVPGSHLTVRAGGVLNAYSLLDDGHRPEVYRIGVRLAGEGGGSAWLHREAVPGVVLGAAAPRSAFPPILSARSHLLLCAGIGVTPILSHLRAAGRWGRPVSLVAGAASGREAFARELDDLAPPGALRVSGRAALLDAVSEALGAQPVGTHAYACGPDGFLAAVRQRADALGWPEERLHIEHFDAPVLDAGSAFDVVVDGLAHPVTVPAGQSLLHALDGAGVRVDRLCERGVCGRCEIGVRSGVILHRDAALTDADRARGDLMLACVSRGDGTRDLDLDALDRRHDRGDDLEGLRELGMGARR